VQGERAASAALFVARIWTVVDDVNARDHCDTTVAL
jgi:hypothetical protein